MKPAKLGQHFLVNKNVCEKIVKRFLPAKGAILEIGPGKGILTERILSYMENNTLTAIELDNMLFYKLKNRFGHRDDFGVMNRDILKIDLYRLFPDVERFNVVGNVPYYISKELMDWVINHHGKIVKGMFMMQKEFVEKVTIMTDPRSVNAQTVLFNILFTWERVMDVQPGSFSPQPRVKSSVFLFHPVREPAIPEEDRKDFYLYLQKCFKNRRKTLFNNLSPSSHTEELWEIFETHHINPKIRAEQVTVDEFVKIYNALRSKPV